MAQTADPGSRLLTDVELPERYTVRRRIAAGGMASVWCAEDRELSRSVAIKLLCEAYADDAAANRRFKREARTAARLSSHRHVVTIFDVGEAPRRDSPRGCAFIVMEYLAGGTTADALRVGAVAPREVLRWMTEAASAIDYAHAQGVIHRDIKPANFLLDRDRMLKVADFGIAQLGTEHTLSGSGEMLGTAAYVGPERALGEPATEASDRYSLAVSAFELLVGERPFTAETFPALVRQHVEEEPPPASARNPDLPGAVDEVLARGLAKRPERRWPSAMEFAAALEEAFEAPRRLSPRRPQPTPSGRYVLRDPLAADALAARPVNAAPGRPAAPERVTAPERLAAPPRLIHASPPTRRRRIRRATAAGAVLLTFGAVAAVAAGTGSSPLAGPAAGSPASSSSTTTRTSATTTAANVTVPAASGSSPAQASALEAQGHGLVSDGSYGEAIPILRQAARAAAPGSLTYAYALFDLGHALRLAGHPRAAVKVLKARLAIPNQLPVVEQELALAEQQAAAAN